MQEELHFEGGRGVGKKKENNYCYTLEHINEYINN